MSQVRFGLRHASGIAVFVIVGHAPNHVRAESLLAQQSQPPPITSTSQSPIASPVSQLPQTSAGQIPSTEGAELESKVRPSVIWVTVFDSKGNLLRTESGFFISADGRFVTTAHAIEGAVNAVAKTGDGGIYNVSGVLAASKELDLAVLQAEVKRVPFVEPARNIDVRVGTGVLVVGSALAGNE